MTSRPRPRPTAAPPTSFRLPPSRLRTFARWRPVASVALALGLILVLQITGQVRTAAAVSRTWTGVVSGQWSNPSNWSPAGAPVDNDELIFPNGPTTTTMTNDIVGLDLATMIFSGPAGSGYTVGGQAITLVNGAVLQANSGTHTLTIPINLGSEPRFVSVATETKLIVTGVLSGASGPVKTGGGELEIGGTSANTYTAETWIQNGTLRVPVGAVGNRIPAALRIGDDTGAAESAVFIQQAGGVIVASDPVTVESDGLWQFDVAAGSSTEGIHSLVLDRGRVVIAADETINLFAAPTTVLTMTGGRIEGGEIMLNGKTVSATGVAASENNARATITSRVDLGGTVTLTVPNSPHLLPDDLLMSGVIEGAGGFIKTGTGNLGLEGANTYTGTTALNAGFITVDNPLALGFGDGTAGNGTTVANGTAIFLVAGAVAVANEHLTLNGAGVGGALGHSGSGSITWAGPVVLASNSTIGFASPSGRLVITGTVSGSGGLTKSGPGTLELGGTASNTYGGLTVVNEGTLELSKSMFNLGIGVPAGLTVGDGSGAANSAVVRVLNTASNNHVQGTVTVNPDGRLELQDDDAIDALTVDRGSVVLTNALLTLVNGSLQMTGGSISGTGEARVTVQTPSPQVVTNASATTATIGVRLDLDGSVNGTFTVADGAAALDLDVTGLLRSEPSGVNKAGPGTMRLGGMTDYFGNTTVTAGTLRVDGPTTSPALLTGGALSGSGSTGNLFANGGTVAPGTSPGTLSTRNLTLNAGASYVAELNGVGTGTAHDQLNVTGTVTLNSPSLLVATVNPFTSVGGTTFTIINNDGNDAINGTFQGAPEGAVLMIGRPLRISYVGGDGNDVVLTDLTSVGTVQFSQATLSGGEAVGQRIVNLVVTRTGGSDGAVTATCSVSGGTADAADFTLTTGSVSWASGEQGPRECRVTVIDDALDEPDETVQLTLAVTSGPSPLGSPSVATITITDDDEPPPGGTVQFGQAELSGGEAAGQRVVVIPVTRTGGSAGAVTGTCAVTGGTADSADFTLTIGSVSFAAGEQGAKDCRISVTDDSQVEPAETVQLTLSVSGAAALGSPSVALLTIADNDAAGGSTTNWLPILYRSSAGPGG